MIPAYNEARRLPAAIAKLGEFVRDFQRPVEILIMVERSTDGTLELAREAAAGQGDSAPSIVVIDNGPQRGKGFAVRSGMQRTSGEFAFYMDADLSVPLREVSAFLDHFEANPGIDVLVGNRQHPQSQIVRSQSWLRRTMGQSFNRLLCALTLANVRDTQCGFKAFRRRVLQPVFGAQRIDGFAFDVEVLSLAAMMGFRVEDMPVVWINSPESRVRIVRDSIQMLLDAVQIRNALRHRSASQREK